MSTPRMEFSAVLLPDGKVFVAGGKSSNDGSPDVAILIPEIFDPNTELWEQVAPHSVPRKYHSTAILLPDGRVLLAGADNQATGEIYSPSYLFRGTRPVITAAPARIEYGSDFSLEFSSAHNSNTVVLIRLSSVTHSVNMGQRYVQLAESIPSGSAVSIPAPANGNLAPPGFYMLFVVDDDGIPSISRIIQVVETLGDFDANGIVDFVDFAMMAS